MTQHDELTPTLGDLSGTSLATIAEMTPRAPAVLESFGLDYCCGGATTLAVACEEVGASPTLVTDELAKVAQVEPDGRNDYADMDPAELTVHLESVHHSYLHEEMPRLDALAEKVATVHGENHPELLEVRRLYRELYADLQPHLLKEEQVLFPMIRELVENEGNAEFHCGSLSNPISVMMSEHDRDGELLAELRSVTDGYATPDDGCASYKALYDGLAELERDTHLHIHKENNILFPAVVALESANT
ncbi:MAG: iron-sulfur cluster repair di-iron protein [Microthrixaceae bacterium]